MKKWLFIISIFISVIIRAQEVDKIIQKGNDLYKQKQYDQAAAAYDEALSKDSANKIAKFNRANTAYRQAKADDAIKAFDDLAFKSENGGDKAKSYYNKGVVLSNQKRLDESIEAYKSALREDPNDNETRENLQKALVELKKRTPPPPKKEDKKKQQQQNKKQQQQNKMNQKEAEQNLKLLQQKEKELQQRMQRQKSKSSSGGGKKDW
ncbi:MAG TPA: tetratricopeptide repeat protein [Chitinophagaceae bacterium]|nr:tetratricopeptide repeat protein [Chitinophagaceae bacterium]